MHLDNDAYIALGFLVAVLVITGGLTWFIVSRIKR
jgi:hypothetical protein